MRRLCALLALLLACMAAAPALAAGPFDPFDEARIDRKPGAAIPLDTPLRDQDGNATTLRSIASGRVMLLVPVLHNCPNLCGVTLAGIVDAANGQRRYEPGRDFVTVAYGIDPKEGPGDARGDLARLAEQRGPPGAPPIATTAAAASVRAVTSALGYHYAWDPRIGQYAHAAATAVLTPDGRLSRWLYGIAPDPAELATAIGDARARRIGGIIEQLILLCYHYDPQTGTYSLLIDQVVRYAGIATVIAIAGLILMLRKRSA